MSITCEKTRESLSLYIDGKLDDQTMQQVQNHLEICVTCHGELTSMTEMIGVLKDLPEIPLPDDFGNRLHHALMHESKLLKVSHQPGYVPVRKEGRKTAPFNWKRISGVAAVFLVVLAGAGLYSQGFFDQMYNAMYLADQSQEESAGDESDSVDLFARTPYEENDAENQIPFAASIANEDAPTDETSPNIGKMAGNAAPDTQKSAQSLAARDADNTSGEEATGGQGDRGGTSQRHLPEEEDVTITDAAVQSLVENSSSRHTVEARLQDTFSIDIVDFGTLKYSLAQYTKTDEHTEIFVYNIKGTKNGLSVTGQIKIQADASGIRLMPEN